jgi:type VII secretion protein EccB
VWTERDQIQAQAYLRRRLVSALATGDANHPVSPSRRLVLGSAMGAVAVLLCAAGFAIVGLIKPAGSVDWRQSGQVILEQGSGAHFVVAGGLLHPVINEASALLLAGADKTVTASASALDAAPRGATLGIPGAPDALPSATNLLRPTLVTCSSSSADQSPAAVATSTVMVTGPDYAKGMLADMNGLGPRGVLVQVAGSAPYLIAGGYRYQLSGEAAAVALGYQAQTVLPVARDWLDSLPAGRNLDLVAVPDAGRPGPAVGGTATRVGQVLSASGALGGATDYYLVRSGGLELITQTEAVLVIGDTANAAAYPAATPAVLQTSLAGVASAPQYRAGDDAAGYPPRVPAPADVASGTAVVCAAGDGNGAASVAVGPALLLPTGARAMPTGESSGIAVASQVYVPPGSGALVTGPAAPGASKTVTYLITDEGVKFPVASKAARQSLGYGAVTPVPVSSALLELLPTGPVLDSAAARAVVRVGSGG